MYADRPATPPPSSSLAASPLSSSRRAGGLCTPSPPSRPQQRAAKRRRTAADGPSTLRPLSPSSPAQTVTLTAGPSRSQPGARLVVRGNVTPSRAAPFFQLRPSQASSIPASSSSPLQPSSSQLRHPSSSAPLYPSPRSILQLTSPTPRRLNHAFKTTARPGDTDTALLQSLLRRPPPAAAVPYAAGNPATTLLALRSMSNSVHYSTSLPSPQAAAARGLYNRPLRGINTRSYLSTFSSREDLDWYELESSLYSHDTPSMASLPDQQPQLAHPLCCAYSYSSRAAEPSAQWLAIGDNEGRIVLLNTLDDSTADEYSGGPQWRVSGPSPLRSSAPNTSVFELSWRHDDVLLASSAPNYGVAVWDVSSQCCTELFSGPKGSSRSIQWDPMGGGHLLCSGGRDGAVHLFDRRVRPHERSLSAMDEDGASGTAPTNGMPAPVQPVLSIWGAHTSQTPRTKIAKGTARPRTATVATRHQDSWHPLQRGVTALSYLPGRPHCIATGGCEDGRVRVWDWRSVGALDITSSAAASVNLTCEPTSHFGRILSESDKVNSVSSSRPSDEIDEDLPKPTSQSIRTIHNGARAESSRQRALGSTSKAAGTQPIEESLDVTRLGKRNKSSHGISSLVVGNGTIFAACTDANIYALNSSCLVAGLPATSSVARQAALPALALYNPSQRGNTLYAKVALDPSEQILAVGCNSGRVVLYDVKCKGGTDSTDLGLDTSTGVVLQGGHHANSEINGLSWANGPQGTTLATIADDFTVRTWRPDRAFSQRHRGAGVAPLELEEDELFDWEAREAKVWRAGELDDWEEADAIMDEDSASDDDWDPPMRGVYGRSGSRLAFDSD